jgi:CDGSH-type Zn-finger protein
MPNSYHAAATEPDKGSLRPRGALGWGMFRRRVSARRAAASTTITPCEDGPLIVRGDFRLQTPDGEPIDPGRGTIALCRCGKSAIKPFCDGTHKKIHFKAGTAREGPAA